MQQLSTGKRINSAKDDAAGLAIAARMTQNIQSLNQSVRNANDAISLIQTAEGATNEITSMLQRMSELAVQSSNATYSKEQRGYLDQEFQQLKQEIVRVAETHQWNGINLLSGNNPVGTAKSSGVTEHSTITFKPLLQGQSITIDGLSYEATIDNTAEDVASAFSNLQSESTPNPSNAPKGSYSGQLTNFNSSSVNGKIVIFTSKEININIKNISVSYSSPNPTVTTTQGTGTITEFSHVNFKAMNVGDSITIAGLKYTATVFNSPQDVERAFSNLAPNTPSSSIPQTNKLKGIFLGTLIHFGTDNTTASQNITTNQVTDLNHPPIVNYIEFSDASGAKQKITLENSASISKSNGEISVKDGNLYIGNGYNYRLIAAVDTTNNGTNGILRFNYINDAVNFNYDFNYNKDNANNLSTSIGGWTPTNDYIRLDGTLSSGGFPTIIDANSANGGTDEASSVSSGIYSVKLINDSGRLENGLSVELKQVLNGVANTSTGIGGVVHGPAILSNDPIHLSPGDQINFDWRANAGDNAIDVVAYLIDINTGNSEIILNRKGSPGVSIDWQNYNYSVETEGDYNIAFVCGSRNSTKGYDTTASFNFDNIKIKPTSTSLNLTQINKIKSNLTFNENNSGVLNFTSDTSNTNVNDISVSSEIAAVNVSTVEGSSPDPIDPNKKISNAKFDFQVGPSPDQIISIEIPDFGKNGNVTGDVTNDISSTNVATTMASMEVIEKINNSLDSVSTTRATMGAVMNRLQHVVDNLTNVSMNEEASRSQIEDADYASASTELARTQIMQQAATAVLAQANMDLNMVLKLLNG